MNFRTRRICSFLLALVLAAAVFPGHTFAYGAAGMTGEGTVGDPYVVMTLEHLDAVRDDMDAHYVLGADIDASATAAWDGGQGFLPIGDFVDAGEFTGTFDGAGHIIRGLTINRPSKDYIGLFGWVGETGAVKRLGMKDVSIVGHTWLGGIAGRSNGTVEDSFVTGKLQGTGGIVGGLLGINGIEALVTRSYAEADVTASLYYGGGLIGYNDGGISESYATGNVSGTGYVGGLAGVSIAGEIYRSYAKGDVSAGDRPAGGLIGYNENGMVSQTYATGDVSGSGAVGGLVGMTDFGYVGHSYATGSIEGPAGYSGGLIGSNNGGTNEHLYWDAETTGRLSACGFDNDYGGICTGTGLTTAQALSQASYPGLDFTAAWFMVDGSTRPFLRAEWSASIRTPHQLQLMAMDLTADYSLANDIDFGTALTDNSRSDLWATSKDEGLGFAPIGTMNGSYDGEFNGMDSVIRNVTIRRPAADRTGLFGMIGSGSVVRNIELAGGAITGLNRVGALVGDNNGGTVERAASSVSVTGNEDVGGLIGFNGNGSTLALSHVSGAVYGVNSVGGLVGYNQRVSSGADVSLSYVTGAVYGELQVGGLVGTNHGGIIENAYAAASVDGDEEVGGLVGRTALGSVRQTYAVGPVSGVEAGGLAGSKPSGTVVDSFYNRETTGASDDTGKGVPLTTSELKRPAVYPSGWDFAGTWRLTEGKTYPVLRVIAANLELDAAPPTVVGAEIEAAHPDRVIVVFDEEVSTANGAGFAIRVDGSEAGIRSVGGTGPQTRKLIFFLEEAVEYGQTVTVSYESLIGHVLDQANVPLLGFADLGVDTSELPLPDVVPPTITVSMTEVNGREYRNGTWTNEAVAVRAEAKDEIGVASFVYSLDGGNRWSDYKPEDIVLQEDGAYTVLFKAADAAGNEATERRMVNISRSGLRLTPMLMKANGDAYANRAWSNLSVTVSVYAEGGASGLADLTVSRNGGAAEKYDNDVPLVLEQEGVHTLMFRASDAAGNTLSIPLEVRIDKTAPSVSFNPNGNEIPVRTAATTVTAADGSIGSGLDASTLQYAWSTDTTAPAAGWTPFASGDKIARSEGVGDWYLHIRAADAAGNVTHAVSNRYRISAPPPVESGGSDSSDSSNDEERRLMYTRNSIGTNGATLMIGGMRIGIPAGALSRSFTLMTAEIDDPSHLPLPEGAQWAGGVFDLKKDVEGTFNKDITLTLPLSEGYAPAEGMEIGLYWLNEESNEWVPLNDITIDKTARTVSGTTNHFTIFAALAVPALEAPKPQQPEPAQPMPPESSFTDISGHWAEQSILMLANLDAATGYPDGTFRPDSTVTRAEFAAMLIRALELPEQDGSPFADIEQHWARQAVSTAYAQGIVRGRGDTHFAPDDLVTREEMSLMAVNALRPEAAREFASFTDQSDISPWARQAVAAAVALGIVSGYPDNAFKPQSNATRAEAVAVILRVLEFN
ncbi:S-layer homology domain-containing protein [Paenibacillus chartarius]|uniref:S-layer homology domain-containing protein n=1 Tax=Paenibacillus chartarius TaxID=747481 RepID=A0ABV6DPM8_9BACL